MNRLFSLSGRGSRIARACCLLGLLCVSNLVLAQGSGEPVPASPEVSTPAAATTREEPASAEHEEHHYSEPAEMSQLVVLVFKPDGTPLGVGVSVRTDDGSAATTSADGVARLSVPLGERSVWLELPAGLLEGVDEKREVELGAVQMVRGSSAQLIVNLTADGRVATVEVEGAPEAGVEETLAPDVDRPETPLATVALSGRVVAADSGAAIAGARIYVRGVDVEAVSDVDGAFQLEVPHGSHALSVIHPEYADQTTPEIEVGDAPVDPVRLELTPASAQLDDVVITAPHVRGGVASMFSERRRSPAVHDALGAEDIAKSPDGSASSATRRIVGASIVGGQFLFVRGLGGRYSNTRLNGVALPSTDPDLPGFQLDLFPTSLLSSLTIAKTFSPDIPGDFAGGSLNIETRSFPESFTLKLSLGGTYNSETTGREMLTYDGGKRDFLGFDDGTRALPDRLPAQKMVLSRDGFTQRELDDFSRAFDSSWGLRRRAALPNGSFGVSLGDTLKTEAGDVGYFVSLGYRHSFERYIEQLTSLRLEGTGDEQRITPRETLWQEVGKRSAQIGALVTVEYAPTEAHSIGIVSMVTQTGNDSSSQLTGFSEREARYLERTQFQFVERRLLFNQLLGKHEGLAGLLDVSWQLNAALTNRDQPDTRGVVYTEEPEGMALRIITGSGERFYTQLSQVDMGGGLDVTLPLKEDAVKAGYVGRTSRRQFQARRFAPRLYNDVTSADRRLPPEEFFHPSNAGTLFRMNEVSSPEDAFDARQEWHAGYALIEYAPFEPLRLMGGVRVEHFLQRIEAHPPYLDPNPPQDLPVGHRQDLDYLPAASVLYTFTDEMNLRLAYGGTVARPQLRELSPFVNQDYVRRRTVTGNPELQRTFIHNLDLRWELFPSPTEVLAVSAFYKSFDAPIESVVVDTNGNITYRNIDGASNYGAEFEARLGLERLSSALSGASLMANLALIRSSVQLSPEQLRVATNPDRPLAGQSAFVANLALGYEPEAAPFSAFLYYNVFGRRIAEVGIQGLPDVYEEPVHSLDFTAFYVPDKHWTVGLTASNLLMVPIRYTQGGLNFSRYEPGVSVGLNVGWSN